MKTRTKLTIITGIAMFGIMFLSANAQYMENKSLSHFENSFSIIEEQVRYDVFYNVTNASIDNVQLNCDSSSLTLSILSDYDGTLQLDIPNEMLSGIFMVLVDGQEWDDVSINGNTLTVNFTENTSTVKILGSYDLSTSKNDGVCDVIHNPPHSYIVSPLKQFNSGISFDKIECKDNLVLIQKYDGSPVCVNPSSMWSLTERDWMKLVTFEITSGFPIHEIENGQIISVKLVKDESCLPYIIIEVDSKDSGNLEIFLSRNILDPKINGQDDSFLVIEDGIEVPYSERDNYAEYRILDIPFEQGTKSIEIIATCLI